MSKRSYKLHCPVCRERVVMEYAEGLSEHYDLHCCITLRVYVKERILPHKANEYLKTVPMYDQAEQRLVRYWRKMCRRGGAA